jgi:3-carboxy-cis,cis-muconate cycloisomerase
LALQFGGAAGTLAALGDKGLAVSEVLARELDLPLPEAPWHTHRDRIAEAASVFAILTGTCGKIARDVALMMQDEIGEAFEPAAPGATAPSRRGRNPSAVAAALSAAAVAPNLAASLITAQVQDHELGLSGPQTEWTTFPMLALVTSGAVEAIARIAEGLEINIERMRENLELGGARIMAEAAEYTLAEKIGRAQAQALVQELSARADSEDRPFKELLLADPRVKAELTSAEIEKMLIPLTYLGSAQFFLDRLMLAAQPRSARRTDFRPPEPRPPGAAPSAAMSAPSRSVAAAAVPASEPQASASLEAKPADSPEPPQTGAPAATGSAVVAPADEPELPLGAVKLPSGGEAAPSNAAGPQAPEAAEPMNAGRFAPEEHVEPTTLAAADPEPAAPELPEPVQQPAEGDAPGAFMDVLSRAEAEAQALAEAAAREGKRNRS